MGEDSAAALKRLKRELTAFKEFGLATLVSETQEGVLVFTNEFWTSKQRAAHSLHEISYRACFKPQLPRFFIERLTQPGDLVFDPFMGRGTTIVEAALLGRRVAGNDLNPLSRILTRPRLRPVGIEEIAGRLDTIDWQASSDAPADLLHFYHPDTLRQISALRAHLRASLMELFASPVDEWIRMVATNRLTGHSPGFFSVYTLPPNQAVSVRRQIKINQQRNLTPPPRDVAAIILKKSRSLLKDLLPGDVVHLLRADQDQRIFSQSALDPFPLPENSVQLILTSPPFLDVVDYQGDNWLRGWFNEVDYATLPFIQSKTAAHWQTKMETVFQNLREVLVPGGYIAFEVGEVRGGSLKMENLVLPAAQAAGLHPELVLINAQNFTKTAHCWGVENKSLGTNTNRIVLLRKD